MYYGDYLRYKGYDVTQVMNITDIDDKTIRTSREKKIPLSEVTEPFIAMFHNDRKALHISDANHYPRATFYIPQMVALVKKLWIKALHTRLQTTAFITQLPNSQTTANLPIWTLHH